MKRLLFVLLTLLAYPLFAQQPIDFSTLVHRTHAERTFLLNDYYEVGVRSLDSVQVAEQVREMHALAERHRDKDLRFEAKVVEGHYLVHDRRLDSQHVIDRLREFIDEGEREQLLWFRVRMHSLLGHFYLDRMEQYGHGLFHLSKAADLMEGTDDDDYPLKYLCHAHVGMWLYRLEDYDGALDAYRRAVCPDSTHILSERNKNAFNSIGLIYRKFGQLDSSDYYFHKVVTASRSDDNIWWEGIGSGNLGENHYLRGEFDEAIPLLELDARIAEQADDWGLASNAVMLLGNIALQRGDVRQARQLLDKALSYAYRYNDARRLVAIYPNLAKVAAAEGNATLVALYIDSAAVVKDSLDRLRSSLLTNRARQQLDRERLELKAAKLESERMQQVILRNSIIVILVMLAVVALLLFNRHQERQRARQQRIMEQKRLAETDLQLANVRLQDFVKSMQLKNAELEQTREELERLSSGEELEDGQADLEALQQSTILTDDDWERFQQLFDRVYPGYIGRLAQKHPDLSFTEVRFMALLRMKVPARQMTSMLGVGDNAIRQYRLRLRSRLGLSASDDLAHVAENV